MATVSFPQFMQKVNAVVGKYACGMSANDFADAPWRDLYDDTDGDPDDEDVVETLAEYDDIFAEMARLNGAYD